MCICLNFVLIPAAVGWTRFELRLYLQAKRGDLRPFFMPERLYIPIRAGFAAYGAENDMCPPQGFKRCLTGISNAIFIKWMRKMRTSEFQTKISKIRIGWSNGWSNGWHFYWGSPPHNKKIRFINTPPKCHFLTGFYIPYIKHKTLNINNINLSFCTQIL